ncbi:ABC transporter ATP-binding protein [Falsibacillus pallidus]|uniref:ABC-2 type transport system ATP-binding protein n=1 Tax=Falsibacillus pallidus TaxID=493781 RepID=A0A370GFJ0_9BACI|nr:ABC transporter ATP-binding protein [Falsibacillus pallidus]RDI41956.1 ABC-2 type transport system ATP-binding protein [Falsibacillus pallidus]
MNTIVNVDHVSKSFGSHEVLKDITLSVQEGEIYGLLGPSGSGKTTLVKMMMGLEKATSGEITVHQTTMPSLSQLVNIGYMAQSDALYTDLTAKENLEFFAALYGLGGKRKKERIQTVMEIVGLQNDLSKTIHQYSGGMKRRLSLAISLLHEPKLLILDEPTVGIDPVLRKSIWEQFQALKNAGTAIFVTTHVMDEAERCDKLGLIRDGLLIANDSPEAVKQSNGVGSIEEVFLLSGGVHHAN